MENCIDEKNSNACTLTSNHKLISTFWCWKLYKKGAKPQINMQKTSYFILLVQTSWCYSRKSLTVYGYGNQFYKMLTLTEIQLVSKCSLSKWICKLESVCNRNYFSSMLRHLSTSLASLINVSHLTWIIHQAANQEPASRAVTGAFPMIPTWGFSF